VWAGFDPGVVNALCALNAIDTFMGFTVSGHRHPSDITRGQTTGKILRHANFDPENQLPRIHSARWLFVAYPARGQEMNVRGSESDWDLPVRSAPARLICPVP